MKFSIVSSNGLDNLVISQIDKNLDSQLEIDDRTYKTLYVEYFDDSECEAVGTAYENETDMSYL